MVRRVARTFVVEPFRSLAVVGRRFAVLVPSCAAAVGSRCHRPARTGTGRGRIVQPDKG